MDAFTKRLDALRREVGRTIAANALSFGQLGGPLASPRQALALPAKGLRAWQIGDELRATRPGWNDMRDAQRHAELSRRLGAEIGPFSAAVIGAEHEAEGSFQGQPLSEAMMDMRNNAEGRAAAREGRNIDPGRLQSRLGGGVPAGSAYPPAPPRRR